MLYEVITSSVEPLSYRVTGSFTIIKYTADATADIAGRSPNGVSEYGNGIGAWKRHGSILQDVITSYSIHYTKLYEPNGRIRIVFGQEWNNYDKQNFLNDLKAKVVKKKK